MSLHKMCIKVHLYGLDFAFYKIICIVKTRGKKDYSKEKKSTILFNMVSGMTQKQSNIYYINEWS